MSGYRTYIVAGLMAVASVLFGLGIIDRTMYETIMGLLMGGGVAALRAGVKKDVGR
jgi:hypothetical protein